MNALKAHKANKQGQKMSDNTPLLPEKPVTLISTWKKTALVIALFIGIIGLIIPFILTDNTPKSTPTSSYNPILSQGFTASGIGGMTAVPEIGETKANNILGISDWSSLMTQVGFSFVVGFCIGLALAFFLKVTALIAGIIFLALFGLQYAGLVDVNWSALQSIYDGFITWMQPHASDFKGFIGSNLPSASLAFAGLWVGLKKR